MRKFDEFHDGALEGIWIDKRTVHLFLSTDDGDRSCLVASGVGELALDQMCLGNVIFEVVLHDESELTPKDIRDVFRLVTDPAGDQYCEREFEKAKAAHSILVEINSSYGASCLLIAQSVELLESKEWSRRYQLGLSGDSQK
jgi:hypothetical protein